MEEDITKFNPELAPLKDEADMVYKAIERFKKSRGISPVYIKFPPNAWQSGIIFGYCGLTTKIDRSVSHFELAV